MSDVLSFGELVRLLQDNGFRLVREEGSIRHHGKDGWPHLVRVDHHSSREIPTGTMHAILRAAGIERR